jgi:hypothetical protein
MRFISAIKKSLLTRFQENVKINWNGNDRLLYGTSVVFLKGVTNSLPMFEKPIRVTDADAKSNRSKDPVKVLAVMNAIRRINTSRLEQLRHFSPVVVSTDGLSTSGNKPRSCSRNYPPCS